LVFAKDLTEQIDRSEHVRQRVHAQRRALDHQLAALAVVLGQLRPAPEQLLELGVLVALPGAGGVHLRQQLDRRQIVGNEVDELLGRRDRGGPIAQQRPRDLDDPRQQLALFPLIERHIDAAAIQRHEVLVGGPCGEQRLEVFVGALVRLVLVEHLAVGLLGILGASQRVAQHRRVLEQHVAPKIGLVASQRAPFGLGDLGVLGESGQHLLVRARHVVEPRKLGAQAQEGLAHLVGAGIGGEQLAPDPQRVLAPLLHLFVGRRELGQQLTPRRGVFFGRDDDLHRFGFLRPVLGAPIKRQQATHHGQARARVGGPEGLEGLHRRAVHRLGLEHGQKARDGLLGLRQTLGADLRQLEQHGNPGGVALGSLERLGEHVGQLGPASAPPMDPGQGRQRRVVFGHQLEDRGEALDRARQVSELLLLQLGQPAQRGQACLGLGRDLEPLAVDLRQVIPATRRGVNLLEGSHRRIVVGIQRDDPPVVALRVVGLEQPVARDDGEPIEQAQVLLVRNLDALGPAGRNSGLVDSDQLVPAVGRLRSLLQALTKRFVGGAQGVRPRGPLQIERRRGQLVGGDLAQVLDDLEPLVVAVGRGEQHLVGAHEPGPVALLPVNRKQLAGDLEVVGLDRQRALERLEGALGLAESIATQGRHATVQGNARLGLPDPVRRALQHVDDVPQSPLALVQGGQGIPVVGPHVQVAQAAGGPVVVGNQAQQLGPHGGGVLIAVQTIGVEPTEVAEQDDRIVA